MQIVDGALAAGRAPAQLGQFISVLAGTWPEGTPLWMRREARKTAGFLASEILHGYRCEL